MAAKSDIAYEIIKEKIIKGELQPLSDISEEALQQELNISRTPIREAIQKLSKEGFVYIYARKGTLVSPVNEEIIHAVYEVRLLNEPYISRNVCNMVDEKWLCDMKNRFLNCPQNLNEEERKDYYISLDTELHGGIIKYCNNIFLKDALRIVSDHSQRIRYRTSHVNTDYERSVKEHLEIIEAFLEKNADKVEEKTRTHIIMCQQDSLKYNTNMYRSI